MNKRRSNPTLFDWWYAVTLPKIGGETLSSSQREVVRKARLLSIIVFFLLIIFVTFLPACFALPNRYVLVADLGMMPICLIALVLNRKKHQLIAGALLMVSFEAALVMVILTTVPFDEPSIQQYELFVFGELLAVSLLNPRSVFFVGLFNSVFIAVCLVCTTLSPSFLQPEHALVLDLQKQFWPILLRPIAVQFLVAGVTYLWVAGATNFIQRAYQAEDEAKKAKELAEQRKEKEESERRNLQEGIELVLHNHATAMNQGIISKIPLKEEYVVLWPLVGVVNSLQNRLQHAHQTERELQQIQQAIVLLAERIYQGTFSLQQQVHTKTRLDLLLNALREQSLRHDKENNALREQSLRHNKGD